MITILILKSEERLLNLSQGLQIFVGRNFFQGKSFPIIYQLKYENVPECNNELNLNSVYKLCFITKIDPHNSTIFYYSTAASIFSHAGRLPTIFSTIYTVYIAGDINLSIEPEANVNVNIISENIQQQLGQVLESVNITRSDGPGNLTGELKIKS